MLPTRSCTQRLNNCIEAMGDWSCSENILKVLSEIKIRGECHQSQLKGCNASLYLKCTWYCVFEFLHSVQDTVNMKAIRILQFISLVKIIFVVHLTIKRVTIIFIVNMIVGVKCSFFLHQSLKLLKCEASKIFLNFYSNNWFLTHHHQHLPVPAAPSHVLGLPSLISS